MERLPGGGTGSVGARVFIEAGARVLLTDVDDARGEPILLASAPGGHFRT